MTWSYTVGVEDREAFLNASRTERDRVLAALDEAAATGGEGAEEHRAARAKEITEQSDAATSAAHVLVDLLPGPRYDVVLSGYVRESGSASIAVTVVSTPASLT